jgi:hypothetical protein
MSVHAVSGDTSPWQILAQWRAAQAASTDPDTEATPFGASPGASSGASQAGGTSNAVTGGPPQPAPGLLSFLQQFQAADASTETDSTSGGGATSGTSSPGGDIANVLADLQSLVTQLQQGIAGQGDDASAPASGTGQGTTAANGSATSSGTSGTTAGGTQTGNDLALQVLNGLQGDAWQNPGAGGLLQISV